MWAMWAMVMGDVMGGFARHTEKTERERERERERWQLIVLFPGEEGARGAEQIRHDAVAALA
jgi:hypothetical protein